MVDAQTALLFTAPPDGAGLSKKAIADQFHSTTCAVVQRNEPLLAVVPILSPGRGLQLHRQPGALSARARRNAVLHRRRRFRPRRVTKPDLRLFKHALDWPGLESDHAGWWATTSNRTSAAAALGLSTAWLAPATEKSPESGLPTVRLGTLSELTKVLTHDARTDSRGGRGSRLAADGVDTPKALVEVAGRPQIMNLDSDLRGARLRVDHVHGPDGVQVDAPLPVVVQSCRTPSSLHTDTAPGGAMREPRDQRVCNDDGVRHDCTTTGVGRRPGRRPGPCT